MAPEHKMHAVAVGKYPSRAQAARASELRLLEQAGKIRGLEEEVSFDIAPPNCKDIVYRADFCYTEKNGLEVVEDTKGMFTPVFRLKAKLFMARYPKYEFRISKAQYRKGGIVGFTVVLAREALKRGHSKRKSRVH